ncbi:energy transducer TonB [Pleionea litopenaei]|uniref:Protein TonB n=1 Tax=Pleionea litopenaei TaxID=3070815 RepID=A0AA51RSD8_9GAMM|nr:energy transducer TonB [Pleionea sp. HL-JVS1]WMS86624.1 energy transducer TonB [Pleionea sp. HL-JVS1]
MRYVYAIVIAVVITGGLFFTMLALINSGEHAASEPPAGRVLDFVRLKQDETVQEKERKPKKPPQPEEPPPDLQQPQMDPADMADTNQGMSFEADLSATSGLENGMSLDASDGEYLPIVKVAPIYPRRALARGIEGFVILEFTVTPQGTVVDPKVVRAEPEGIFNQAAIDAAKKFKYKPRVIDGKAVSVPGVQNQITFKMR